ncbi:MAG: hypothetical protein BMS9Abin17_1315 [Acidimicrobiia bacterium]|nr:MAG: hypothetical protein BMS9Abin17_1315 [Acidimicrobiia bacterium]
MIQTISTAASDPLAVVHYTDLIEACNERFGPVKDRFRIEEGHIWT